jgi:non-canonical poly(A) RNA polymerase PAPD5/7
LTSLIKETIGDCEVKAFGSFATGLYLPDGDIDVAILVDSQDDRKIYEAVYSALLKRGDEYCEIDYIRKSKVPLIKFIKTEGWIQFDVSVNKEDGIKQLTEVRKLIDCFPEFRYLAMVLKCALKLRNLG